jgi:hypothetical protein
MEMSLIENLRNINRMELQNDVNSVIRKNLQVTKYTINRENEEKKYDLTRVSLPAKEIQ